MKCTEIIGKKVLDVNAYEIGKINDIELDFENSKITGVYLSSNELTLKKHLYEIRPEDIKV
ncbi:MAG: PRC-barrel domain-containing protein, partial [Methanosphaera sp.]|nr:PRC-barrel domain-containing protein [Methanosphaera sp.]